MYFEQRLIDGEVIRCLKLFRIIIQMPATILIAGFQCVKQICKHFSTKFCHFVQNICISYEEMVKYSYLRTDTRPIVVNSGYIHSKNVNQLIYIH